MYMYIKKNAAYVLKKVCTLGTLTKGCFKTKETYT